MSDKTDRIDDLEYRRAITGMKEIPMPGSFVSTPPQKEHPYGASVVAGKLFFKLLDGSSVLCQCIAEPYASKIVEACKRQGEQPYG